MLNLKTTDCKKIYICKNEIKNMQHIIPNQWKSKKVRTKILEKTRFKVFIITSQP